MKPKNTFLIETWATEIENAVMLSPRVQDERYRVLIRAKEIATRA